jgi:hypothetical protein
LIAGFSAFQRNIMDDVEEVSKSEMVAAAVSGTGTSKFTGSVKVIAYRIPLTTMIAVDALASKANKSRNAMLNMLVDVGIDEVRKQLSDEVCEALMRKESEMFAYLDTQNEESIEE